MAQTQNQRWLFVKCLHHDCRPIPQTGCVHFVRYFCFPAYESIVEIFRYIRMVLCFVRLRFSCSSSRLFLWKPCNAAKWLQKRSKNTAQNGCGATLRVRRPHFEAMLGSSAGCAWWLIIMSFYFQFFNHWSIIIFIVSGATAWWSLAASGSECVGMRLFYNDPVSITELMAWEPLRRFSDRRPSMDGRADRLVVKTSTAQRPGQCLQLLP